MPLDTPGPALVPPGDLAEAIDAAPADAENILDHRALLESTRRRMLAIQIEVDAEAVAEEGAIADDEAEDLGSGDGAPQTGGRQRGGKLPTDDAAPRSLELTGDEVDEYRPGYCCSMFVERCLSRVMVRVPW